MSPPAMLRRLAALAKRWLASAAQQHGSPAGVATGAVNGSFLNQPKFISDLLEALPASVALRDAEGRFVQVNRTWERYFGIRREDALGKRFSELPGWKENPQLAEIAKAAEELDREALRRGPENPLEPMERPRLGRMYLNTRRAFLDSAGRPVGVLAVSLDTTEHRAMEQALATEQRRVALVVRASKAGIVDWDGATRTAYYSPRLKEMLGYPADVDTSAWPDYFDMIHPEDKARVHGAFREHVLAKDGREFHEAIKYRLRRADGSYVWVQGMGVSVRDAKGYATRFIASITDITERRAQEEALRASRDQVAAQAAQLERQNEALAENVRLREEVDRMSRHDIKTPLNTVIAVPRLLREERRLDAEDDELLSMVERAGYRILNMVNLSLDLFKMEQGTYRFRPQTVDLVRLLDAVLSDVQRHAASKNVALRVVRDLAAGASGPVNALAEELLCYSILANLLKNAVEASPDGKTVTVSLAAGDDVRVGIHNRGVVPPEIRERFFEKYATARKSEGTGLGTYSAWLMARVQEGDLAMETSEEHGTTLTLRLRAVAEAPATAGQPSTPEHADAVPGDELPRMRVLVVDDDEYNRLVVRRYLPSPPIEVATAVNGRAAVAVALATPPDVILMDLEMPVMNGFEAVKVLRAHERASGRPAAVIIALSSHDDEETQRRSQAAGFDAYLMKPVSGATLRRTLRGIARSGRVASVSAAGGEDSAAAAAGPADFVEVDPDLKESLPLFLGSRRAALDEMGRALEAGARGELRRLAHRLVGSFALYGFRWASKQCQRIERDVERDLRQHLADLLAALRRHLETVEIRCAGEPCIVKGGSGDAREDNAPHRG